MTATRNYVQITSVLFTSVALMAASSSASLSAPQASLSAGDKCTVTSGPNKGETGTYGDDGWCEGDWGGTECVSTKCKATAVLNHKNMGNQIVHAKTAKQKFMFRTFTSIAKFKN